MALEPQLPKIRNARTQAVIARETFWQITVPIAAAVIVVAALVVLVIMSTVVPVRTGAIADVSLIFMIMLYGGAGLLILLVLVALCVAAWYGLRELPFLFKRAQDFLWIVAMNARTATRQVDNRVVEVHLSMAALDSLYESFMDLVRPRRR
jgi:hypothetical protein